MPSTHFSAAFGYPKIDFGYTFGTHFFHYIILGAQNELGKYNRQKSFRRQETRSTIKIEDNGTRVTLAFSPLDAKNYSLTSSKPRCDWEKFMAPKYRCLSRAVLTVFVVFLTFLTIYVITIYGFKFTNDKVSGASVDPPLILTNDKSV